MNERRIFGEFETPQGRMDLEWFCSGPIIALNEFHRELQRKHKFKPDEYKTIRVYEEYRDASGATIESEFDLPSGPNPDVLSPKKQGKDKTAAMFSEEDLRSCDTKRRLGPAHN